MPKLLSFLLLICIVKFGVAQEIKVGSKVEVTATDGKVYKGTVKQIIHTAHQIHYDGYEDKYDVWMTKDQFRLVSGSATPTTAPATTTFPTNNSSTPTTNASTQNTVGWQVGSKVEAFSSKKWSPGSIVEIKDGKYKIRWDGWGEGWDQWVTSAELRSPGANSGVNVSLDKAAKGKLYLRHIRYFNGNTALDWYFLADNGTIVVDPKHGVNPVNLAEERVDNMNNMGTYIIANNQLKVKWLNGRTSDLQLEYKNGDIIGIDVGSIVMRQTGLPANYKLNGTYSGVMTSASVAAGSRFTFSNSGSFTSTGTGYVSTGAGNGTTEKQSSGTYSISGNTLTLQYSDGRVEKSVIAVWENRLVINGVSMPLIGR